MGDILVMRSPNVCSRAVLELHTSPGMHALGLPKWQLVLCVLLVFIILYLALFKGVNSSGKVRFRGPPCSRRGSTLFYVRYGRIT